MPLGMILPAIELVKFTNLQLVKFTKMDEIRKVEAQIAQAEIKLEEAEQKHANQPSEETKVDLAFKRRTVEQLRDKEFQLRELLLLRLKAPAGSPDSGIAYENSILVSILFQLNNRNTRRWYRCLPRFSCDCFVGCRIANFQSVLLEIVHGCGGGGIPYLLGSALCG
jgi:hypothetical protein